MSADQKTISSQNSRNTLTWRLVVNVILLITILIFITLPWYPVITKQNVIEGLQSTPQKTSTFRSIYKLSSAVTLQGLPNPTGSTSPSPVTSFHDLGDVVLEAGWVIHLEVSQCIACFTTISQDFGSNATVFDVAGSVREDFLVAKSGRYKITIENYDTAQGVITSMILTADTAQFGAETKNSAATYTKYNISGLSPITLLTTENTFDRRPIVVLLICLLAALFASISYRSKV